MKTASLLVASLCLSQSAFAALPPYYDSVAKLKAILDSPEVAEAFNQGASIDQMGKLSTGLKYFVHGDGGCGAHVELEAHAPDHPGPTTYTVKDVSRVCE